MQSVKYKYTLYLIVICAVIGLLLLTCGNIFFEELITVKGIGAATGMFTFLEICTIWFVESKSQKLSPRQSVNFLLGMKVGKILIALLFLTVYALTVKIETQRFVMAFIALYLIYLLFDTIYLTRREKSLKSVIKN